MFLTRQVTKVLKSKQHSIFKHGIASTSSMNASSLVLADHDNNVLNNVTLSVITAAKEIGGDVTVLVAGEGCDNVANEVAQVEGVTSVLLADDPAYGHGVAENITELMFTCQTANNYTHLIAGGSNTGKNVIPRISAALSTDPIIEILSVEGEDTFTRPMYAGNAIAKVTSEAGVKILSVRGTAFEKANASGGSATVDVAPAPGSTDAGLTKWVSDEISKSDRPDLTAASTVIAGGRGLKSGENFEMLEELADKLGAAVGASRAAVDAGYVPNDYQVGQTGKVVAPDLYVAVGISGAIQHLAGMKESKIIVTINKDPEAPIFQVSDYGLVDDLFKAVPEMNGKV
jgi:electron transfer flavoprotein alpha subunit